MKTKLLSTLFATTSAASVVTPALSSLNVSGSLNINMVHESDIDRQYGISKKTYDNLKKDFNKKVQKKLNDQMIRPGSELWNSTMESMEMTLQAFDKESNTRPMDYTTLTSSVIDVARKQFGVQLRRTSNVKWSDINEMFQGCLDSFSLYMDHEHISSDAKMNVINTATKKFNAMLTELEAKNYKENDPFGALQEARNQMFELFDSTNAFIAKISASIQLQNFVAKFNITPKPEAMYSDIKDELAENVPLTDSQVNEIFDIINTENGQKIEFSGNSMIPGLTVAPVFKSKSSRFATNSYSISVDWTAVSTNYGNTNDKESATAHLYESDLNKVCMPQLTEGYSKDLKDDEGGEMLLNTLNQLPIKLTTYPLNEKESAKKTALKSAYFYGNDALRFIFPESTDKNTKLEPFYNQYGYEYKGNKVGVALTQDLADAGMQVIDTVDGVQSKRYLSEVIIAANSKKPEQYTKAEKFVANCVMFSISEINQTNSNESNEVSNVKNTLYVKYLDHTSDNIDWTNKKIVEPLLKDIDQSEWLLIPKKSQPEDCIDYKTSAEYFKNLCIKFTDVKRTVDTFAHLDKDIKTLQTDWYLLLASHSINLVTASITLGVFIAMLIQDLKVPDKLTLTSTYIAENEGVEQLYKGNEEKEFTSTNNGATIKGLFIANYSVVCSYWKFVGLASVRRHDILGIISASATIALEISIMAFVGVKMITPLNDILKLYKDYSPKYQYMIDKANDIVNSDFERIAFLDNEAIKNDRTVPIANTDYQSKLNVYMKQPFAWYKQKHEFYSNWNWLKIPGATQESVQAFLDFKEEYTKKLNEYNKKVFGQALNNKDIKYTFQIRSYVGVLTVLSAVASLFAISTTMLLLLRLLKNFEIKEEVLGKKGGPEEKEVTLEFENRLFMTGDKFESLAVPTAWNQKLLGIKNELNSLYNKDGGHFAYTKSAAQKIANLSIEFVIGTVYLSILEVIGIAATATSLVSVLTIGKEALLAPVDPQHDVKTIDAEKMVRDLIQIKG